MIFMMIFKRYYGEGFDNIFLWDFHWDLIGVYWGSLGDFLWDLLGISWGLSVGSLGDFMWDLLGIS
jgi:hypothetical protein